MKILLAILIFTIISQVTSTPINKQATVAQITEPKVIAAPASVKEDTPVVVQEQTVAPIVTAAKPACDSYDALIIENFGSENLITAKAIMRAESGCDASAIGDNHITYAQNGTTYGMSCGLFQIRVLPTRPPCSQLQDARFNIEYAAKMFAGQGWQPWSAYTNQSYRRFLQ